MKWGCIFTPKGKCLNNSKPSFVVFPYYWVDM